MEISNLTHLNSLNGHLSVISEAAMSEINEEKLFNSQISNNVSKLLSGQNVGELEHNLTDVMMNISEQESVLSLLVKMASSDPEMWMSAKNEFQTKFLYPEIERLAEELAEQKV